MIEILNVDYQLWHKSRISINKATTKGLTIGNVAVKKFSHRYVNSSNNVEFMYYHTAYKIEPTKMKMNVPLDMNGERIINSPFIKPPMLAFPGKYLKTRVDKYVFFGGTDIKITPTSCKLTKLYFHTPELGFTDNFCFFSVDIMTKHSRSYSYAGKSWPYQVISPNLAISFGNAVRISLRNEDPPLPFPPQKKSQEATVM